MISAQPASWETTVVLHTHITHMTETGNYYKLVCICKPPAFFLQRIDMPQNLVCVTVYEAMRGTDGEWDMEIAVHVLYKICYTKAMQA